jgi:hypothetical protein
MEQDQEVHAIIKRREIDERTKTVEKRVKALKDETKDKWTNLTEKRGKHLSDHRRFEF